MYSGSKHSSKIHLACSFSAIFFLFLAVSFFIACSKDDQTEVQKTKKIVMPINKSVSPNTSTSLQKEETKEKEDEQQSPVTISQENKTESEVETTETTPETITLNLENETPHSTTNVVQVSDVPSEEKQIEMPQDDTEQDGLYTVEKGDSLSKISERNDIYGNPLKWTSLFRLNMSKFKEMELTRYFHIQELPEGLILRFVTSSEAAEVLAEFDNRIYSVNVLSTETSKQITLHATTLLTNGFNAYICTGTANDKEWMRLRVGFFKNHSEAVEVGKQISSVLNGTNVWVVEIGKTETNDYCGY